MRSWFALVFAASGGAALIYEVTWTRLLTLQLGHGVAAASTVLAAFMGGLAVGSALGGRYGAALDPSRALRTYAVLELLVGVLALVLPYELRALDPLLARAYADGAGGTSFGVLRLATSLLLLSVPAAAMGATFPIASRWFVQHAGHAARDAGNLYAANTIGAAVGALAAGFVLLPFLGLAGATWVGVALNIVAAGGAWQIAKTTASAHATAAAPLSVAVGTPPADTGAASRTNAALRQPHPSASVGVSPSLAKGQVDLRRAKSDGARPARTRRARAAQALQGHREDAAAQPSRRRRGLAAAALGISGFASLTLQVVWTRLLALMLGPTTYAFSTMVAVFIAGLAVGAALAARFMARPRSAATAQPIVGLAICLALSVGFAAAAAIFVDRGMLAVAAVVARPDVTFAEVVIRQALIAIALLAPMTIAFGAAFPFAVAVATRDTDTVTADLGFIYAVNTAGAITGALASGFVLIPWLGLHGTIRTVTIVGAIGAIGILAMDRGVRRVSFAGAAIAVAVLALGILLPPWDRLLLSSGAYKYAAVMQAPDLRLGLSAGELLYYGEGPSGTVAVRRAGGTTSLSIDGKVDASNAGDMLTQRLLAHVPLLLHPNPRKVAILGLGSGVTLGSALTHPLERADVLEISPEVVEASRYFDVENHRAMADPRTRLIVGDGRTHLLLTRDKYDVIVSEPSNPWMAGIASLFTREFFAAARDRLEPDGVLCQWAHTYDISTQDLRSIVATFVSVFPDGTLWLVGDGDVLLVGSRSPLDSRIASVAQSWQRPRVAADLASVGVLQPFHLLSMFIAQGAGLAAWAGDAPVQSDNRAALEFSGPQSIFGRASADNAMLLRELGARPGARPAAVEQALATATPADRRDRGWMLLSADAFRPAYTDFVQAAEQDPKDLRTLEGLIRASAPLKRSGETRALLSRLAADPTGLSAKLALSRLLASEGAYDEAVSIPLGILQGDPGNVPALEQMASVLSDLGDAERMKPVVARLRAEAPSSEAAHYYSAALLFMEDRTDLALNEARRVLAVNPRHAKAHNLMGACLASLGQREQARAAFHASIAADPRDPATYANLATLELQSGNRIQAAKYFAEALTIDPGSEAARRGLAETSR
jgi:spermidine synthase